MGLVERAGLDTVTPSTTTHIPEWLPRGKTSDNAGTLLASICSVSSVTSLLLSANKTVYPEDFTVFVIMFLCVIYTAWFG